MLAYKLIKRQFMGALVDITKTAYVHKSSALKVDNFGVFTKLFPTRYAFSGLR